MLVWPIDNFKEPFYFHLFNERSYPHYIPLHHFFCIFDNLYPFFPITESDEAEANEVFTIQPLPMYYVSAKRPVTLRCAAKDAADIHIKCNKAYIDDADITKVQATLNGQPILTVS